MHVNRSSRAAFTLLEVILALALSAMLLGALAVAIQTSLKATYSGRSDVAEAQLARAALERIANDLRAAVWIEQPDPASMVPPAAVASLGSNSSGGSGGAPGAPGSSPTGGSSNVSNSQGSSSSRGGGGANASRGGSNSGGGTGASSNSGNASGSNNSGNRSASGSGGGNRSGGGGGGGGGASGGGAGSSSGANSSSNTSTTTTQMPLPMFIGGQNWLQVDISHLPRPDQYAFMQNPALASAGGNAAASSAAGGGAAGGSAAAGTTVRDRISEMKTVYYFLAGAGGAAGQLPPGLSAGMTGGQQGLMRREADRAATAWTMYGGGSAGMGPALEALAPEIESLSFQYFNGSGWTNTWDSRVNYCLPRAVEIRIRLADESATKNDSKVSARPSPKTAPPKEYVLRVPLPAWRPPNLQLLNSLSNQASANGGGTSGMSNTSGAGGMGSY